MKEITANLQSIFWSKDIKNLDFQKDKVYIVHQVLSCGSLDQIRWLFRIYPKSKVRQIFVTYPKKLYQPAVFYFVKNFLLELRNTKLDERKYYKTTLRDIK